MFFHYKEEAPPGKSGGLVYHSKRTLHKSILPTERETVYIGSGWRNVSWESKDGAIQKSTIRADYEIIERAINRYGQYLLTADL